MPEQDVTLPAGGTEEEARAELLKKDHDAPLLRKAERVGHNVTFTFDVPKKK